MSRLIDILQSVGCGLVLREIDVRASAICRHVIECLHPFVPEDLRDRYVEEWLSHLEQEKTSFSQVVHTVGCLLAVPRLITAECLRILTVRREIIQDIAKTKLTLKEARAKLESLALVVPTEQAKTSLSSTVSGLLTVENSCFLSTEAINMVTIKDVLRLVGIDWPLERKIEVEIDDFHCRAERLRQRCQKPNS